MDAFLNYLIKRPFPHLNAVFHILQLYLEHKYFRKNLELLKGILPFFAQMFMFCDIALTIISLDY